MINKNPYQFSTALPARFKFGLAVGGASLVLALFLWLSSRNNAPRKANEPLSPPVQANLVITEGVFKAGRPLASVLGQMSFAPRLVHDIGLALTKIIDPRELKSGDAYKIGRTADGAFMNLIVTRGLTQYVVEKDVAGFKAYTSQIPVTTSEKGRAGTIQVSLWESMKAQQLTAELIMGFADVFAWTVDFLTEPRAGDKFALVWENMTTPDGLVVERKITAALYDGPQAGRNVAVLFDGEYYDQDGKSLRKAFLRAPLNFRRISSGFTHRRFHPILRYFRPHLGIDYAAPTGTPVVSIGDGTVIYRGWKSGFGNFVQVRHNSTYVSCYGHFSRFAKIRVGQHVKQGQVVGYVGSTGHATGPHLDFRMVKNGSYVNFLSLKLPPDKDVPAARRQAFITLRDERIKQLEEQLKTIVISANTDQPAV